MRSARDSLRRVGLYALPALVVLLFAACGKRASSPPASEDNPDAFSLMTYNLHNYSMLDRDGDGQKNNPKPVAECEALVEIVRSIQPDVLAVQEMGDPALFEEFQFRLRQAGLSYPHTDYLQRGRSENNLAVLSRFPIVEKRHHIEDTYRIGPAVVPVSRGFLEVEIQVTPTYTFRLIVAHLKSKVFHSLGQTEMRRNEARLLGKHARDALKENPALRLAVVGDMNDDPDSAAIREITGKGQQYLVDTRPADPQGDVWTHFTPGADTHARIDYIFVSPEMFAGFLRERSHVVRSPLTAQASDHRPLVAVFSTRDTTPTNAPPPH